MTVTIGELCMGYGGLGMGLSLALGGDTRLAWAVEYDKHPSAIISHRYPGVTNYGDVKTAPWHEMERVDWLTAGYPCQPFSLAGLRKGTDDPRHLWPGVAAAISVLRPRNVLLENVAGHLRLGFDTVLADLAGLGYDAQWGVVRAADAGAPHGRARLFVVATDAHRVHDGTRQRPDRMAGEGPAHSPHRRPDVLAGGGNRHGADEGSGNPYGPAIERWERVLGRPAPRATSNDGRLNPSFVEWMMGLPAGWVVDVPGLSRDARLKALGNGVVPQQAALACRLLGVESQS